MPRDNQPTPRWHPISQLSLIASLIAQGLAVAQEQHDLYQQASHKPHVLDDATVDRALKQCREELDHLWWYEEQLARWQREPLTEAQRKEIQRLSEYIPRIRALSETSVKLLGKIRTGTINRILEKSDEELGMEAFERMHRNSPEARTPLTPRQKRLAARIDQWIKGVIKRGGGDEEILQEMVDYMSVFKKILGTSTEAQVDALCVNYAGFYRFAVLLEDLARGIADGTIEVPD